MIKKYKARIRCKKNICIMPVKNNVEVKIEEIKNYE